MGIADFNGDGRLDIIINNNNATPTLYLNNLANSGNSIEMKLVGTRSNRDAIGAVVRVSVNGKTMMRQVEAGSGYASASMLPVHFGLGAASKIEAVEIIWPSGTVQRIEGSALDALTVNYLVRIEESSSPSPTVMTARELPRVVSAVYDAK